MSSLTKAKANKLPQTPGVYIFRVNKKPVYIGKAKNLKARVSSYFNAPLSGKTAKMIEEANRLDFIKTASELEAILLEAKLVRDRMPKYNSQLKDDKSPLYIAITLEEFPRVLTLRKTQLQKQELKAVFGPFTRGKTVKKVLKLLRRSFPFSTHKPGKRACLYNQIGLCQPCPSKIKTPSEKKEYLTNIRSLKKALSGDIKTVKRDLQQKMRKFSQEENFEAAQTLRNQILSLDYITQTPPQVTPYLGNPNFVEDLRQTELSALKKLLQDFFAIENLKRIECFDVAHLAGTNPTASMVTFVDGEPEKKLYRHFRIKKASSSDDTGALKEVLSRRIKSDWGKSDLIIIDGGKPQVTAALEILGSDAPVIGLAKRYETVIVKDKKKKFHSLKPKGPSLFLLQRIRNEAHRFARRLHHKHVLNAILERK